MKNLTAFPVRWTYTWQESPPKAFSFSPEGGGVLEPFGSCLLHATFEAPQKSAVAQAKVCLKCADVEGLCSGTEVKTLNRESQVALARQARGNMPQGRALAEGRDLWEAALSAQSPPRLFSLTRESNFLLGLGIWTSGMSRPTRRPRFL